MPIYEYGCQGCGHQLEVQQKLADAPLKSCPSCGKDLLEKLISSTSFVLKGGGWYKDGYGGGAGKRSDNQVSDRLTKAISDDKKKTESVASSASTDSSSSSTTSASTTSASTTTTSTSTTSTNTSEAKKASG